MERRAELPEVNQPLKESIDKLQSGQKQLKAIAEALKPLNLTGEALVLIKGDRALVIPEKACRELEKLGRMTLEIDRTEIHELALIGVGRSVSQDIDLVEGFVLPSRENVLAVKQDGNIGLPVEKPRTTVMDALEKIVESGGKRGRELFPKQFPSEIFTDSDIKLEDITGKHWEVISHTRTYRFTKYYWEKLREAPGATLFDVHIHPVYSGMDYRQEVSDGDIMSSAGARQFVEWFGILGVDPLLAPERFIFSKEKLTSYYSSIDDITGFKKGWEAMDKSKMPETYDDATATIYFAYDFAQSQRAVIKTYAELLEKVG